MMDCLQRETEAHGMSDGINGRFSLARDHFSMDQIRPMQSVSMLAAGLSCSACD